MDGPRNCHIECNQAEKEKYGMIQQQNLKNDTHELIYKMETDSQT